MRYAQIVIGLKGNGKSTYCKLIAKYSESKGRKMKIINLDARSGVLQYEGAIADIRDVVKSEDYDSYESATAATGAGFNYTLKYLMEHKDWFFGAISEVRDGDHVLFDCPGELEYQAHLVSLREFLHEFLPMDFRCCAIFVRDAQISLNGYYFIGSCFTPLASFLNLSVPHINIMMKYDKLNDEKKQKLQLLINSDMRDILRYESSKSRNDEDLQLENLSSVAATILDGMSVVRKKYYPLDITCEESLKNCLALVDEVLGVPDD